MKDRQIQIFTVITVGMVLTWTSVGLRCYTRLFISKTFGSDDYWMILALLFFTTASGIGYMGIHYGIGLHSDQLTYEQLITGVKFQVMLELVYILATAVIKTSVGLLLLRITSVKPFYKWLIWGSLTLIWAWTIVTFIIGCLQCRPLYAVWSPLVAGECLEPSTITAFAYAISAETIFFDWLFALLPIPMLWNIKMTSQLKVSIMVILGLGIIASSATIVRLRYLVAFENLTDALYSIGPVSVWSSTELSLGITAASISTLRPLLRSWHIIGFSSDRDSSHDPRGPRSLGGYQKHTSSSKKANVSHDSSVLNSPQENTGFSTLHIRPSASAGSEEILGARNGVGNEGVGERDDEEYELASQPDREVMKRLNIPIVYAERVENLGKDMV